jgi:hypothetical protein
MAGLNFIMPGQDPLKDAGLGKLAKVLDPLGWGGKVMKAVGDPLGLFKKKPKPFAIDQSGAYILNGKKGGKQQIGGTINPDGTFVGGKGVTPELQARLQEAINTGNFAGLPKNTTRFVKAAQDYLSNRGPQAPANGPGAASYGGLGNAPGGMAYGPAAFANLLPSIMGNQAAFARPAAQSWLSSMFGADAQGNIPMQSQPPAAIAPAQGSGGMMYPGGTPGFYSGGYGGGYVNDGVISPFGGLAPAAGSATGQKLDPQAQLARFAGPMGNGGAPIAPMPENPFMAAGIKNMYM